MLVFVLVAGRGRNTDYLGGTGQVYESGSKCLFDTEISSPVIRVAIPATTFNKMNVANQDYYRYKKCSMYNQ